MKFRLTGDVSWIDDADYNTIQTRLNNVSEWFEDHGEWNAHPPEFYLFQFAASDIKGFVAALQSKGWGYLLGAPVPEAHDRYATYEIQSFFMSPDEPIEVRMRLVDVE